MPWKKSTFENAVMEFLNEFDKHPTLQTLALIWRAPDEYTVQGDWMLERIKAELGEETLRVVLWLTREEAILMILMLNGEK